MTPEVLTGKRTWLNQAADRIASATQWGYAPDGSIATEPAALCTLAMLATNRNQVALRGINWLLEQQSTDGSLGIGLGQKNPRWPTSLAVLAWQFAQSHLTDDKMQHHLETAIARGIEWILSVKGETQSRHKIIGHDTTLAGWPWVLGTHSWLEPTCMHLMALRATGNGEHTRANIAVEMLIDRLMARGGCNYGNVSVFGQQLLPHLQPTGLCMLALSNRSEETEDPRVERSLVYLQTNVTGKTTTASLCYGLMGLAAHNRSPHSADAWLQKSYQARSSSEFSTYHLALLVLAGLSDRNPLITMTHNPKSEKATS